MTVPELCTAERLARELGMPTAKLMDLSESLGERIDSPVRPIPTELLELLAMECGSSVQVQSVDVSPRPSPSAEDRARLPLRPPVITLMGHVDHGKTSLLDALRESNVAAGEAGGITQAISAFMVREGTQQAMTFIDTPGHELFGAMRERGARATDIVVLVVAIDAGVQPTTIQAIEFAREMGVPIIVAANKMDRPDAHSQLERVKRQLLEHGVVSEDLGGEVPVVGVSATKRMHLDELSEAMLLQAEMLELHCEDSGPAEAVVLEATTQKGLGIVTTALVQRGMLEQSNFVVAGTTWGKVRVMHSTEASAKPQAVRSASPSTPIRISGLRELPRTGDQLLVVESEAQAKQVSEFRTARQLLEQEAEMHRLRQSACAQGSDHTVNGQDGSSTGTDDEVDSLGPKLVPALLKADTAGALEALQSAIAHFPEDRVKLKVVKADVGAVSAGDVELAETVGAAIVGFNVRATGKVEALAEENGVAIHTHDIVYELADGVKNILEEAMDPIIEEKVVGLAEVLQLFTLTLNRKDRKDGMSKFTQVAGCRVSEGEASIAARVRISRREDVVHEGSAVSLKHFKQEVKTVRRGQECGLVLANFSGCEEGDAVTFYELVARKPSLYE